MKNMFIQGNSFCFEGFFYFNFDINFIKINGDLSGILDGMGI